MDISPIQRPESVQSTQSGAGKKRNPIAKLHIERSSVLDPDLVAIYRDGLEINAFSYRALYGDSFDQFPVPNSLFEATQALASFFESSVNARLASFLQVLGDHLGGDVIIINAVSYLQKTLSPRYKAGLLRNGQIELVKAAHESIVRRWTRLMDLEVRDYAAYQDVRNSWFCLLDNFILKIRSERLENLLLKYLSENDDSEVVVQAVWRATTLFDKEFKRQETLDREGDGSATYEYANVIAAREKRDKHDVLRERAWNVLYHS